MTRHNKQRGFTVIELMLAMGGIAFLLLFVVMAIMQVTGLYTKGVAIRQINQAGRQISDDISRAVRYGAQPVLIADKHRLCVGGKSYIWNNPNDTTYINSKVGGGDLSFVVLNSGLYCSSVPPTSPSNDIPASATESIGNIAMLQDMSITKQDPASPIYELKIILSTSGDNAPSTAAGVLECDPIRGQFCAFGEFQTSIYARGE